MIKLITAILLLANVSMSTFPARAQTVRSVQNEGQGLGSPDWFAYIDIEKLQLHSNRTSESIFERYSANLKPDSFFLKKIWPPSDCWAGSTLRKGIAAYCFPYARLGYHKSVAGPMPMEGFVSIAGPVPNAGPGLYVWHAPQENLFYLWDWNFEFVFGPFVGDPLTSLRNAVKPSKGKRHFSKVSLTAISQRWTYPDERQARMPRNDHYDCAHGHLSGRVIEREQLNSFITRLRLTNTSGLGLYYLTPIGSDEPLGYRLTKYAGNQDWDRATIPFRYCDSMPYSLWRQLPPGGAVEFEVTSRGWPGAEHAFVVVLNDERVFWDEVELLGIYRTMVRKFSDEQKTFP